MRVLIACSDASVRDAFSGRAAAGRYRRHLRGDAAATLELARQQRPEIVLLDDELSGIGGVVRPAEAGRREPGFGARRPRRTVRSGEWRARRPGGRRRVTGPELRDRVGESLRDPLKGLRPLSRLDFPGRLAGTSRAAQNTRRARCA